MNRSSDVEKLIVHLRAGCAETDSGGEKSACLVLFDQLKQSPDVDIYFEFSPQQCSLILGLFLPFRSLVFLKEVSLNGAV